MPFFKRDQETVLTASSFVIGPGFELRAENKNTYEYPVDGWFWFDTLDEALPYLRKTVSSVSMRQARLALLQVGLLAQVETQLQQMSEPAKTAAWIEWEYAKDVERNGSLVILLGGSLGLSNQQVDELFLLASTL